MILGVMILSRATQKYHFGICVKCGNSREEENTTIWCNECAKKIIISHTGKLSYE